MRFDINRALVILMEEHFTISNPLQAMLDKQLQQLILHIIERKAEELTLEKITQIEMIKISCNTLLLGVMEKIQKLLIEMYINQH